MSRSVKMRDISATSDVKSIKSVIQPLLNEFSEEDVEEAEAYLTHWHASMSKTMPKKVLNQANNMIKSHSRQAMEQQEKTQAGKKKTEKKPKNITKNKWRKLKQQQAQTRNMQNCTAAIEKKIFSSSSLFSNSSSKETSTLSLDSSSGETAGLPNEKENTELTKNWIELEKEYEQKSSQVCEQKISQVDAIEKQLSELAMKFKSQLSGELKEDKSLSANDNDSSFSVFVSSRSKTSPGVAVADAEKKRTEIVATKTHNQKIKTKAKRKTRGKRK